jgi:hypothetical protein
MAAVQQALGEGKTGRKTCSTTGNGIREGERRKRDRASEKAARKDGAERLRQAADREVGRNSAKLAVVLKEKALNGDLASTKMLVALADGKKPIPEVNRPLTSLVRRLAAEPQWVGPPEGEEKGGWEDEED